MTFLWTDQSKLHAAFIDRQLERQGVFFRSVTDHEDAVDAAAALEHNRYIASGYLGRPGLHLSMARQVHGHHVLITRRPGLAGNADGLVTDKPGLALGVLVADCAALLLADPVHRVVAAVHAGWRGAVAGIVPVSVRRMQSMGADPGEIRAYLSPCISREVFEVGEEVACRFPDSYVDRSRPKPHVDLRGFLSREINQAGIPETSVIHDHTCTVRNERTLHSHRRDGQQSGRMLAVICLSDT